eukprot:TRINITY_DN56619_c0_g1_i1.p1 TRINITY_DN56619_c0_g1~~TRINITY_DN56619_c0_g1_i1.p1  ORF type:complete len:235 (+),score=29.83 TRINITY_DN56619_c0_g1_i1:103-807(+)
MAMVDASLITVTAKQMSGATAFGPEAVLKVLTVRELKNLWDAGAPKEIMFGNRLMQDDETLEELPLEADLTVAMVSRASLRAQDAAVVLQQADTYGLINSCHHRRPLRLASIAYTGCLLALEAVHGRNIRCWTGLGFGGIPHMSRLSPVPGEMPEMRKLQAHYWPNGRVLPLEPLLKALRTIEHGALEIAVNNDNELRNEFQALFAAIDEKRDDPVGAWHVFVQWLEVSIRPLL